MAQVILKSENSSVKTNSIKEVEIDELFGYYRYIISNSNETNVLMLYGDNGSGKTTILKMMFYLLSTKNRQGYKTSLANIKFKRICVRLFSGIEIIAERLEATLGGFNYQIKRGEKSLAKVFVPTILSGEGEYVVSSEFTSSNIDYIKIINIINDLGVSMYFLKDDRTIMIGASDNNEVDRSINRRINISKRDISEKDSKKGIDLAFERFTYWIRNKIFTYSGIGEKNNQTIYIELVKSIASDYVFAESKIESKVELLNTLDFLHEKNNEFVKYNLVNNFNYLELSKVLRRVKNPQKIEMISNILTPFINGAVAKTVTIKEIYDIIKLFIENVNEYFHDKKINFDVHFGFKVIHDSGEEVQFRELSSGEQHLLLLWINTITAEDATIFIIDEPEISLNIKWQRRLLESLRFYSAGRDIQFVIATHSIELLSRNMKEVVKLSNLNAK